MNPYTLILLALIILGLIYKRQLDRLPPAQRKQQINRTLLYALAAVLIVLMLTGRVHWLFAALGALLPLAQRALVLWRTANMLKGFRKRYPGSTTTGPRQGGGQTSQVESAYLRMSLDHDSGTLEGEVLQGRYRGQRLSGLNLQQLQELYQEISNASDQQALTLLQTYLDRVHGSAWRKGKPNNIDMDKAQAYEILGLQPGASAAEIRTAHRRLMQKLHPDRGGSTFLAAQINKAKDILLDE